MTTLNHHDASHMYTKAIYHLDDDRLTYCVAAPGHARPREFATQPGDGQTLVTLKRHAPRSPAGRG